MLSRISSDIVGKMLSLYNGSEGFVGLTVAWEQANIDLLSAVPFRDRDAQLPDAERSGEITVAWKRKGGEAEYSIVYCPSDDFFSIEDNDSCLWICNRCIVYRLSIRRLYLDRAC